MSKGDETETEDAFFLNKAICLKRLVLFQDADTSATFKRGMRGLVERNGCVHGALVLAERGTPSSDIDVIWTDRTSRHDVVTVMRALDGALGVKPLTTGDLLGSWSTGFDRISGEATAIVSNVWGCANLCAVKIFRRGDTDAWLLLGGGREETRDQFKLRILGARADLLRLLATVLTQAVQRVFPPHLPKRLSSAEIDVLSKLADGMRPAEIAATRGASLATVRNQISRIRRRLAVASDAQAVALALRNGLI